MHAWISSHKLSRVSSSMRSALCIRRTTKGPRLSNCWASFSENLCPQQKKNKSDVKKWLIIVCTCVCLHYHCMYMRMPTLSLYVQAYAYIIIVCTCICLHYHCMCIHMPTLSLYVHAYAYTIIVCGYICLHYHCMYRHKYIQLHLCMHMYLSTSPFLFITCTAPNIAALSSPPSLSIMMGTHSSERMS